MDSRIGAIVGGVVAAALLIISARNMGNISSVDRKVRRFSAGKAGDSEKLTKIDERLGQVQEDLMKARTKITRLEAKIAGVESASEAAARSIAKSLLEKEREEIVAEAIEKAKSAGTSADLEPLKKDITSLRAAVAKLRADQAGMASARSAAKASRPPAAEPRQDRSNRGGAERTEGEERKRPDADKVAKAREDFKDLFQKRRNGELTDKEFREKIQELREKYPDMGGRRGGRRPEGGNN